MPAGLGELTATINLDTSAFDRQIRRVRRQAVTARIWTHLWLSLYAAAATGAAIAFAVVDLVR